MKIDINDSEQSLLHEALNCLLEKKQEALHAVNSDLKDSPLFKGRIFAPHDFGIPQINALKAKVMPDEEPEDLSDIKGFHPHD